MTRRISKIPASAKIEPITKQYTKSFQPVQFGKKAKVKAQAKAPAKSAGAAPSPARSAGASPAPAPRQQPPPKPQPSAAALAHAKQQAENQEKGPQEPPKPYASLLSTLRALWMDRALHGDLCPAPEVFQAYTEKVLSKINNSCNILERMQPNKKQEKLWVKNFLKPLLNGLGQFFSQICRHAYHGNRSAEALKKDLEARLYGSIDLAVRDYKWFRLQKVLPYKHKYNHFLPKQTLVGTVPVPGKLVDVILEINSVGLMSLNNLAIIEEAQVVIGVAD